MSVRISRELLNILQDEQHLTKGQLDKALNIAKIQNKKLDEVLVEEGIASEEIVLEALSLYLGIPRVRLNEMYISPEIVELIPEYYARKYTAFPIKKDGNTLMIALRDPRNILAVDDIRIATGLDLQIVIAAKSEIDIAIEDYYGKSSSEDTFREAGEVLYQSNDNNTEGMGATPVVRIVDTLIQQATKKGASDIHIEPQEKNVIVRYRIDGMLSKIMTFSKTQHMPVISRIKIIANLDITTKRLPQDGRFECSIDNQTIDIRVSIIPTINGEKAVLRLLNRSKPLLKLQQLGFSKAQTRSLKGMLDIPYGMILVTGPVGSGKTTTLYSMLNIVNTPTKNIVTLEDPVEYIMPGINQIQIDLKVGITFARGLRAILRQDPNIIMVGEIRDQETAYIAVRAALTGHLVFSTLHTNNAAGAINRLLDMGVEPYLLASCLVGVISQRLVRKICPHCKREELAERKKNNILFFRGVGCSFCNFTGFKGRTAVGEIVTIHQKHRDIISKRAPSSYFDRVSRELGYKNLLDNGMNLVRNGTISYSELLSNIYQE